jgi:hypothetical protein
MGDIATDTIRMYLARACIRAIHPDAIGRLHAALVELEPDWPPGLVECPAYRRGVLPERIREHDRPRGRCDAGP